MSKKCWLAMVACTALLAACGSKKGPDQAEGGGKGAAEPVTPVEVAKVERGTIHHVITADAILYAVDQANVTAKISAPVKRFQVNRGDHVRAGQLLAQLENRDLEAGVQESKQLVEQAQAAYQTTTGAQMPEDLTKAQADVQSAKQALEAAQRVYESRVQLQNEGALAQKLVEDAKVALVQAQSQLQTAQRHLASLEQVGRRELVKNAQAQVDAAKARLQNAEAQLSYSEIRSPISGVVSDRPLYAGEMAPSGTAIVSVVDISRVTARANIPVKEAAAIRVGKPATISGPGAEVRGKVTVVSPAVDPNTTTVEVWVQAPNPGEKLKPGVTVKVVIAAEEIRNALIAPAAALLSSEEGGDKVMVIGKDSLAHEHKVDVGVREGEKVQIVKGVEEGEDVITVGGLGLDDKAKVQVGKGEDKEDKDAGKKEDDKK